MLALSRLLLFLIIIACAYVNCHIILALDCAPIEISGDEGVEFIWVGVKRLEDKVSILDLREPRLRGSDSQLDDLPSRFATVALRLTN